MSERDAEQVPEKSVELEKRTSLSQQEIVIEEEKKKDVDIDEHMLTLEEVEKRHVTSFAHGLTKEGIEERLERYGINALTPPPKKPEWKKFVESMTGFFSLLLWAGGILCFISYGIDQSSVDNLGLGVVLVVVVILTGCFSYYQESKSAAIMEGFAKLVPQETQVRRNGETMSIPAVELVPGDVVMIVGGDKIPADVRCIEVSNFKVDNSSLTGESEPQKRSADAETQDNPLEAKNLAFFGTEAQEGRCTGIVIRTGDNTVMGKIATLVSQGEDVATPIGIEIEHFIKFVSAVAIILGIIFLAIALARGFGAVESLVFMIGIIVANVPEGLLATVTVALTLTAQQMAKKNVLVKNLESVETLGSTTVIASDKTGTLTQNRMTAAHLYYDGKVVLAHGRSESSYNPESTTFKLLELACAVCTKATFDTSAENLAKPILQRRVDGDASETAFIKFFEPIHNVVSLREQNRELAGIPFKSANKYQVSINLQGNDESKDRLMTMKGAPERIWDRCDTIYIDGTMVPKAEYQSNYDNATRTLMMGGERVLGVAFRYLPVSEFGSDFEYCTDDDAENFPMTGLCFLGLVALIDPPRAAVPKAVLNCQSAGIKVVMVTGDHPDTAEAIAKQVNIIRDKTRRDLAMDRGCEISDVDPDDPEIKALVIEGKMLSTMNDEQLDHVLDYDQIVFARTSPQQKHQIVSGLQKKTHIRRNYEGEGKPVKHIVAVTGDGVNDSPALKLADIGIAMGIAGSDVAKNAADMILLDDNFASIVNGIEEGRLIFDNLKKSIAYTLSSNIPEITPFIFFIILSIPLPLPTILILCIDLGTDLVPAISLAYERKEADIMKKPPRDARVDRLVTMKLISFSYLQIGMIQAAAGFFSYFVVLNDYGFAPSFLIGTAQFFEDGEVINGVFFDEDGNNKGTVHPCRLNGGPCHDPELALRHAQTAFFVAIVIVQWADVLICKTRTLSIKTQGLNNFVMNVGLIEETILAIILCYVPVLEFLGTRAIAFEHWLPPLPFAMVIFFYDEFRKFAMRNLGKNNWVYRNTYY